jgi:hypothetical protein
MNKKREKEKELDELLEWFHTDVYEIIISLLLKGENINLNKVRLIKYVTDSGEKGVSLHKASKDLGIDYKNIWRYNQQLKKAKVFITDEKTTQGKSSKVKIPKKIVIN